jgi:hypothetical protein
VVHRDFVYVVPGLSNQPLPGNPGFGSGLSGPSVGEFTTVDLGRTSDDSLHLFFRDDVKETSKA